MENLALKERLLALGLTEDEVGLLAAEGVKTEADMQLLNAVEIKELTACGLVTAKNIVVAFTPAPVVAEPVAELETSAGAEVGATDVLPSVPDDISFLEMLKVGGIAKVDPVDVMAAIKAALANRVGLYELPAKIADRMEVHAQELEEPVGKEYFELQKLVTARNYGDLLQALGTTGNFMSEKRKREFLLKLDVNMWEALYEFQQELVAWQNSWAAGMANPGLLMVALSAGKIPGGALPPGMMQPPDTAGLRDAAEAVINRINKVFAGPGIPVARALGYDATRIKGVLEEATLPAAMGASNREQMLKMLDAGVSADFVRIERNVTKFALAVMELPKVSSGTEENTYLGAMLMLGMAIPWDKLNKGGATSGSTTFR